jgi:integrase
VLRVIRFAKAKGLTTTSAAEMREDMTHLLPQVNGTKRHFTALDYRAVPAFVQQLRAVQHEAASPNVIEFILLTAARESEVCEMRWGEIDWAERVWTLPASRSKTNVEHRVPLSDRGMALLARQRGPNGVGTQPDPDGYVWSSRNAQGHINGKSAYKFLVKSMGVDATIHGLRSSFRDWCGDTTPFARDHVEECLGHAVGNAVERAYRRSDALEKRRTIMAAWSAYCEGK